MSAHLMERGSAWAMHLGECTEVMPGLATVEHVITDPPYSAQTHQGVRSMRRSELPDAAMQECRTRRVVDLGFEHLDAATRRRCARLFASLATRWVAVFSDTESDWMWRLSLGAAGLQYVRTAWWDRVGGAPQFTGDRPAIAVEAITLAHPLGRKRWNGGGKRGIYSVPIVANRSGHRRSRVHTTQKPIDLMLALVADFTDPGETILDPFAGSGTTGVAALRLGRRFVGVERKREYFDVAVARLRAEEAGSTMDAALAGQGALFGGAR